MRAMTAKSKDGYMTYAQMTPAQFAAAIRRTR